MKRYIAGLALLASMGCAPTEVDETGTAERPAICTRHCTGTEGSSERDGRDRTYAATTMFPSAAASARGIAKYGLQKQQAAINVLGAEYAVLGRLEFPGHDATWKRYRYVTPSGPLLVSISESLLATRLEDSSGAWAEYRGRLNGRDVAIELLPGSDAGLYARRQIDVERALVAIAETTNYVAKLRFAWPGQEVPEEGQGQTDVNDGGAYTNGFCSAEFGSCNSGYTLSGPADGYGGGWAGGPFTGRRGDATGQTCSGREVREIGFGGFKNWAAERARAAANAECSNSTCIGCCAWLNAGGTYDKTGEANCYCAFGDLSCYCTVMAMACAT